MLPRKAGLLICSFLLEALFLGPTDGQLYTIYDMMMPTTPRATTRAPTTTTRAATTTTTRAPVFYYNYYGDPVTQAPATTTTTARPTTTTTTIPVATTPARPMYYDAYYGTYNAMTAAPTTTRASTTTRRPTTTASPVYSYNYNTNNIVQSYVQYGPQSGMQYPSSGLGGGSSMQLGPYFGPAQMTVQSRSYSFPFSSIFFNPMDSRNLFIELSS